MAGTCSRWKQTQCKGVHWDGRPKGSVAEVDLSCPGEEQWKEN